MYAARVLTLFVVWLGLAWPAMAQGPLTPGVPATGQLASAADVDVWTLSDVEAGDALILGVRSLGPSGFAVDHTLTDPNGVTRLGGYTGSSSVIHLQATATGTYTLTMTVHSSSVLSGSYDVQWLKVPGSFVVPAGDQGGPLTAGVAVTGQAPPADLDPWTFTGCIGATPRIEVSETPPDPVNPFSPGLYLFGPSGTPVVLQPVASTVATTAPLQAAGTYTLVVFSLRPGYTGPGPYTLNVTGMCGGASGPPTGQPDQYTVAFNTPLTVTAPGVLGNDTSPGGLAMTAAIQGQPQHGSVTLNADGGFTYVPAGGYAGADAFSYRPADANGPGNETTVSITVAAPALVHPPTDLIAASITGSTIRLRWTPPTSGSVPTGYLLEGGLAPGDTIASLPTGSPDPVLTIDAPSGVFYLRVRTLSGSQSSAASNEIVVHVNVPVAPSAPSNLLGMANGSAVALAWRNTYGGGAPTGLTLEVTGALNASLPIGFADHFTFPAVPPGSYNFAVRATNSFGASPPSNAVSLTFPSACTGVPETPAHLLVHAQGSTISVSWDPAASGAAPTSFTLDVTGTVHITLPVGATRSISGGVGPGTYSIRVSASNACGTSGYTAPKAVTIP